MWFTIQQGLFTLGFAAALYAIARVINCFSLWREDSGKDGFIDKILAWVFVLLCLFSLPVAIPFGLIDMWHGRRSIDREDAKIAAMRRALEQRCATCDKTDPFDFYETLPGEDDPWGRTHRTQIPPTSLPWKQSYTTPPKEATQSAKLTFPYFTVVLAVFCLVLVICFLRLSSEKRQTSAQHAILEAEYAQLEQQYEELKVQNETLKSARDNIMTSRNIAQAECAFWRERAVIVTTTGDKYHTYGCSHIKNTPVKVYIYSVAGPLGYSPCLDCHPVGTDEYLKRIGRTTTIDWEAVKEKAAELSRERYEALRR